MRLENDLVMCEMEVKPESDSDGMTFDVLCMRENFGSENFEIETASDSNCQDQQEI